MIRTPLHNIALSAVLLCWLAACQQQSSVTQINFGLASAPITLDPRYATDAESWRVCHLLYRRLVDFGNDFNPVPDLAVWETISPRHYRFHLREGDGRQFHHGKHLNSQDVKASYESILHGEPPSPHRGSLSGIREIVLIDEDTLDFFLDADDPLFPGKLVIGILPADLIAKQHPFNSKPVGSGEMRFQSWPTRGQLKLVRLKDGQPVQLLLSKDPTVRTLKLLRGELDIIQSNMPPELIRWLEKQRSINITRTPGHNVFTYLGFNLRDPVSGSLHIRKAIAHGIDRQAIIQHIFDHTVTAAETILPPTHWAAATLPETHFDISKAMRHVAAYREEHALAETEPVSISYKTSSNPLRLRLATIIQHQLEQIGLHLNIQSHDWGTFYDDIKQGRFQMYSLSWVGLKMPDVFRYIYHSDSLPPQGANRGGLKNSRVDALIERAERTVEPVEQAKLYRTLQRLLHEILVFVPLWYEDQVVMQRDSIHNYHAHPDGNYDGLLTAIKLSGTRYSDTNPTFPDAITNQN